jgi:hypothetical protein
VGEGSKADSGGGGRGFMSGVFSAVRSTFFSVILLRTIFEKVFPFLLLQANNSICNIALIQS